MNPRRFTGTIWVLTVVLCAVAWPYRAPAQAPTGLVCTQVDVEKVQLTWVNPQVYDGLRIFRDGAWLADVAGNDTTYLDVDASLGSHIYALRPCTGECPETPELGTHVVKVYLDGETAPAAALDVTAGDGDEEDYSYLAMGAGATGQTGAVDVDFVRVALGKAAPADATYPAPEGGWLYAYEADAGEDSPGVSEAGALDGTWDHNNGSSEWDGSALGGVLGTGNAPGGAGILEEDATSFLRYQDPGDPRDYPNPTASPAANYVDPSNRKIYFTHDLTTQGAGDAILDEGVTLHFRARIPTAAPIDKNHPDGGGAIVDYPAGGDGYAIHDGGKGNFGINQRSGGIVSFSLSTTGDAGVNGIVMNNLNGSAVTGDVDSGEPGQARIVPLDPTAWHDVWVTISGKSGSTGPSCTVNVLTLLPPTNLACAQNGQAVELSWQNPWVYSKIRIFRDGASIDEIDGTEAAYTDPAPPPGSHTYHVMPCLGETCPETPELGTHVVKVYLDGATTPAAILDTTAGTGQDFAGSYVALGLGETGQTGAADVDFVRVALGKNAPADETYPAPAGGWLYAYEADTGQGSPGDANGAGALDGTWSHNNGSDEWDGSPLGGALGAGNAPGGVEILEEGATSFLRYQDPGDPTAHGYPAPSNQKIYLFHDLAQEDAGGTILDEGVTLYFGARIPTAAPIDQRYPEGGGAIVDYPAGGDGYAIHSDGKGNVGIRQQAGGIISFCLATQAENSVGALILNKQNGKQVSGNVDTADAGGVANAIALDPTVWHDVWVVISKNNGLSGPSCTLKVCPTEGDTACTGLELTQIEGTTKVQATATAEDASGDTGLRYTFTAENGVDEPIVIGPQAGNTAEFELTEGEWTISAAIDDDASCGDPPGTCSETITITVTTGGLQKPVDANQDGKLDISDGIAILSFLFLGGPPSDLPCGDGTSSDPGNFALVNANGDTGVDISDAVWLLNWLFTGGPRPANCLDDTCPCIRIPGCPDVPIPTACQ